MRAEHHGNIEFHWNGKRRLSAREAARIQTFPDDFVFYPSTTSAYKQIGNAVPPVLAWHLAKAIEQFIEKNLERKRDLYEYTKPDLPAFEVKAA
jgi:DNA (cytosine-5)-methyltransferase 1